MQEENLKIESRYSIEWEPDGLGFFINGRSPTKISIKDETEISVYKADSKYSVSYGLFEFHKIMNAAVDSIMVDWKPKTEKAKRKIEVWAKKQCGKALSRRVRDNWKILLSKTDQKYVDVQRRAFNVLYSIPNAITHKKFYENTYLVKDVLKYRAAALSLGNYSNGQWYHHDTSDSFSWDTPPEGCSDWMSFFSIDRKPYTSLNKTLMGLPGGIPYWLADEFRRFRFERPITNRIELISLLSTRTNRHSSILMHSNEKQLRRAIGAYTDSRREKANFRKAGYIKEAIQFICDYPGVHNGNVVGLAEKSIRWHREDAFTQQKHLCRIPLDTPTALPPIDLPKVDGIKFMATAGEIIERGIEQKHCVGSYAERAVNGHCYLFNIEYKGQQATAEVSQLGDVVQVQGPHNGKNKATAWGRQKLTTWGKNMPQVQKFKKWKYEPVPF